MQECDYGCGNEAQYEFNNGKYCCSRNYQSCPEVRRKNSNKIKKAHKNGEIPKKQLDGNRGANKGRMFADEDKYFCKESEYRTSDVRRVIIRHNLIDYECGECGRKEWRGEKLPLELHHKNGNKKDHRIKNLIFLCPNCHSITKNWRGKDSVGNKKVSDQKIIETIPKCESIRQVCLEVGLSGKGGNHPRIRKLMKNNTVELK